MTVRKYSSRSQQTTLSAPLASGASSMSVVSGSALMGGKTLTGTQTYTVVIDPDTALEEIVDVTVYSSGNTLTITRNIDGSTGQAHSAGAVVRHMAIGRDYQEANNHIETSSAVHGLSGTVVGTTDTQTLTNKTLTTPTITSPTITGTGAIAGTFTGNLTGNVTGTVSGNAGTVTNGIYTTDTGTVTSTMIANNTIVDADINTAAAIAKTKVSGTAITAADTGTVTSAMIANDTIVDADINSAAGIAKSKLALTGAITSSDIANDTIVNADINTAAAISLSKLATDPLARANHTGTQTAATISDFDTQVRTSRLDQMAAPTAAVSANSQKITNLATPTATTDASTKAYVDAQITALVGGAPGTLDTLSEIASAINNSGSFATSVVLRDGTQAMTGALAMGTNKITGMGTPTVSTDAATKGYVDGVTVAPSNLTGPITSVGSATSIASQTGTGSTFVVQNTPTLTTPVLGVATATSINGTTIPSTKTLVVTTDKLSALAATTSAELAGVISDETGSGALVFGTSPTISNPVINNFVLGYSTTVTAGATTTLTNSSNNQQLFTGTTTQTVVMPVASTMTVGTRYVIENNSTGVVTVQSSGLNTIATVPGGTSIKITCILASGTTAASWDYEFVGFGTVTGTGSAVLATSPTLVTPVLGDATGTSLGLTVASGTTVPLTIQNNGTGNSFVVNDQASDTTPFVIDQSGNMTVGGTVNIQGGSDSGYNLNQWQETTGDFAGNIASFALKFSTGSNTARTERMRIAADGAVSIPLVQNQQAASYTVVFADAGKLVEVSNASANNLTVPLNSSVAYPIGTQINILQTGAGQTTVVATGGVTINATPGLKLRAQWSSATLIKRGTDTWVLVGDLSA